MEEGRSFSALQHLLTLAHSPDNKDQQQAAMELAQLIEDNSFPAVSLGPLVHALSRLLPSSNRSVAMYAARAVKGLLLDDALRPQAAASGIVGVVCDALKHWEDEAICVRELLATLQTLCWDKACVKAVLAQGVLENVLEYVQATDAEVSSAAAATLANVLSYCDTLLLSDEQAIHHLAANMGMVVERLKKEKDRTHKCYLAACVANASANPVLAGALLQSGALELMKDFETKALATLNLGGSRLLECAQTSIYRLSQRKEGNAKVGMKKYRFKVSIHWNSWDASENDG